MPNPLYPVILIPGIAGSRLITKKKYQEGDLGKGFLWLSKDLAPKDGESEIKEEQMDVSSLAAKAVGFDVPDYKIERSAATEPLERWKKQMTLHTDGKTPIIELEDTEDAPYNEPEKRRAQLGGIAGATNELDAICNLAIPRHLYDNLDDEKKEEIKKLNYFWDLVKQLKDKGYRGEPEGLLPKNLLAAPYDWRTSPTGLEQRYQYFSTLKANIADLKTRTRQKVVIIAHSMGNRVTQYFLEWIKNQEDGQTWIDEHIERYIAVSPPWLGAPMAIRLLSTDDGFNLAGMPLSGMKPVLQSFSSIPWLFPVTETNYHYFNTGGYFGFLKNDKENNPDNVTPLSMKETLLLGKANRSWSYMVDYYQNDPLIGGSQHENGAKGVQCPSVSKLDVIYSVGFETAIGAYYLKESTGNLTVAPIGDEETGIVDEDEYGRFKVKKGIRWETSSLTEQTIDGRMISGDLIVPYASLVYFKKWQESKTSTQITGYEFSGEGSDHNSIVRHQPAIDKILELLGLTETPAQ